MSRIARMHAGGNSYDTGCQGGGDKKAGLVPNATGQILSQPFAWRAALGGLATPGNGRGNGGNQIFVISTVNQLGGIGRKNSMTLGNADGVNLNSIRQRARDCGNTNTRQLRRFFLGANGRGLTRPGVVIPSKTGVGFSSQNNRTTPVMGA